MKKIQYSVWKKETNDAGGKAKNDAFDIALRLGFWPSYYPSEKRPVRVLQQLISMRRFNKADVVFVQYPAVDFKLLRLFVNHLKPMQNSIALIHDLRTLQGNGKDEEAEEIYYLNHFKYIIAHNKAMADFLVSNGCTAHVVCLDLFDYLHDVNIPIQPAKGDKSVTFAGNLRKSTFIKDLKDIRRTNFILYGNKGETDFSKAKNVEYKGTLPSEEIVYKIEGDYGLVWDGETIESCLGKRGEYLRYNNPHKLSLYIAAGKPVITWSQSAIADFVLNNEIGIVVDTLKDLENIDLGYNYAQMRNNVLQIKMAVGAGEYLEKALNRCR